MAKKRPPTHDGLPEWFVTLLKVLGVVALVTVILGAAWAFSSMGPHRVRIGQTPYVSDAEISTDALALLDKSKEDERQFKEVEKNRQITAADLPKLEEAVKLQEEYNERTGQNISAGDRVNDLRTLLQNYQTNPLRDHSLDLEQQAEAAENAGHYDEAISLLRQSAKLQDQVNSDYPLSKNRDFARVAMMEHHIKFLLAQPLSQQSHALEADARAALAKEDWGTAQVDFQKAYDLQSQLNREYSDQQFTDIARQESLNNELVSLRSTGTHKHVEQLLAQAQQAAANPLQAAQYLQDALREQRDLIKNYPQSRFADEALAESIDSQLQTMLSQPVAAEIIRQAGALATALHARHCQEAADTVAVLVQKVEHFRENFPRSPLLQGDLEQRLEYLNFKAADLAAIQDQVYGQLVPLPGQKRWQLMKAEVPQSLYQMVIGGNPSRNPGDKLPVDSVSWADAREFCRHLEWVMARPVRLPTIEEFKLALGPTQTVDVTAVSWNLDNSMGKTQPVATKAANAAGFYDLLGNVAEWLDRPADADDGQAPVAGGNAQTAVDAIRDAQIAMVQMQDRSRFTGFRVIVDMDEAAPVSGVGPTLAGGNTTVPDLPGVPSKKTTSDAKTLK